MTSSPSALKATCCTRISGNWRLCAARITLGILPLVGCAILCRGEHGSMHCMVHINISMNGGRQPLHGPDKTRQFKAVLNYGGCTRQAVGLLKLRNKRGARTSLISSISLRMAAAPAAAFMDRKIARIVSWHTSPEKHAHATQTCEEDF